MKNESSPEKNKTNIIESNFDALEVHYFPELTEEGLREIDAIRKTYFSGLGKGVLELTLPAIYTLKEKYPFSFLLLSKGGRPMGWNIIFPVTYESMQDFISNTKTENDLFQETAQSDKLDSAKSTLYYAEAYLDEGYRKGVLDFSKIIVEQFAHFNEFKSNGIYAWMASEGGRKLVNMLNKREGMSINKIPFVRNGTLM